MLMYLLYDSSNNLKSMSRIEPATIPSGHTVRNVQVPDGWVWDHSAGDFVEPKIPEYQKQRTSLEGKADTALTNNKIFIDTPNAQLTNAQVVNHLKDLTRQVNTLIRLGQERLLVPNTDT